MKLLICLFALMGICSAVPLESADDVQPLPRLKDTRIVGGYTTHISVYPHQASMRYKSLSVPDNPYSHSCGCSLIAPKVLITASHCIIGRVASQLHIIAGANNRRGSDGVRLPVVEIIQHEAYNPDTYENDVALLILAEEMPINNYTIALVELDDTVPKDGAMATISGWGALVEGGSAPNELQVVQAPIVSNEQCNADYGIFGAITDSMLCAGYRGVGGKDACQGDSGGPLLVNRKLTGIVSWGYGCARPKFPGVYASVPHLLPWIKEKMAKYV